MIAKHITIRSPARIHVSLIDLGNATQRMYGGIGFAIDSHHTIVRCQPSDKLSVSGLDTVDIESRQLAHQVAHNTLRKIGAPGASIDYISGPPPHVGLGSKTSLLLSIVTAISHSYSADLSKHMSQKLTSRGGTSGVGIHSFFHGGVVADGGHRREPGQIMLPSSSASQTDVPPIITRNFVPVGWGVKIAIPQIAGVSGSDEVEFFKRQAPIPRHEALDVLALVYHGLIPAIEEGCFTTFRSAINSIQQTGFKRREIDRYGESLRTHIDALRRKDNIAIGLSSMGPCLYCIYPKHDLQAQHDIREYFEVQKIPVSCTQGANKGYVSVSD